MSQYYFLCAQFDDTNFTYAIKSTDSDWHYFEEVDSVVDSHALIRINLDNEMIYIPSNKLCSIAIPMNPDQLVTYVANDRFIFNGNELKTFLQLSCENKEQSAKSGRKNGFEDLIFVHGKTNPVIFLNKFEKCDDVNTDKDKLFKIRNFVNQSDRSEFSNFFFKSDWATARQTFLKKYSLAFTENKKKELSFRFEEESTLRSFVQRKMKAMFAYTTLPLQNQMEMILVELSNEISNLFIINNKMNGTKNEILEFCDAVEEYVDGMDEVTTRTLTPTTNFKQSERNVVQDVEIFDFNEDIETDESSSTMSGRPARRTRDGSTAKGTRGRGVAKAKGTRGRGRPRKALERISEDLELSEFDTSSQSTTNSFSTFSN